MLLVNAERKKKPKSMSISESLSPTVSPLLEPQPFYEEKMSQMSSLVPTPIDLPSPSGVDQKASLKGPNAILQGLSLDRKMSTQSNPSHSMTYDLGAERFATSFDELLHPLPIPGMQAINSSFNFIQYPEDDRAFLANYFEHEF